jgi:protein-S-isoprenylcysteine O-methyltransferase Ste14
MDPINILLGLALFVSIAANFSGSKKGMKAKVISVEKRPKSYLQKLPLNISALIVILEILGVFEIAVFNQEILERYTILRIIGLVMFIVFSWLQTISYKELGEFYSPEISIFKSHKLITDGIYKYIRHPQYFSQILSDLGAGIATMSFLVSPIVILVLLPLFILRAKYEEKLFGEKFGNDWNEYKKRSGFLLPFIG